MIYVLAIENQNPIAELLQQPPSPDGCDFLSIMDGWL
jgi:hypothetical protein